MSTVCASKVKKNLNIVSAGAEGTAEGRKRFKKRFDVIVQTTTREYREHIVM